jgi:hypothetical protein
MPTNPNMVAIQTVTVGSGGAATISFTSIPQTYTDLKIVLSGRTTQASLADSVYFSFNGSTSNFSGIILYGDGGSASSFTQARYAGSQPGSTATASTFANIEMYISNYTSSNNKAYSVDAVTENNATTAYAYTAGGLWSNSAAITSITLTPNAGSFVQHSTATLYGVTSSAYGAKATGGIITSDANYYYHTFLASGTFTPTSNITADYLVVAGGGGSYRDASGGGAGGLRCTVGATGGGGSLESALSLTASTNYTVTIGAGGTGAANGSNSVFSTITSTGGGYGNDYEGNGASGGSGGGAGWDADAPDNAGGAGTTNQGYAGTKGFRVGAPTSSGAAGGGGGAGAAAGSASTGTGGAGGAGVQTSISGIATYYAGGGGGWGGTNGGAGGNGGGGAGYGGSASTGAGTNGTANTGGGAGGARGQNQSGGSGIVIVRYAK